MRLPEVIHEHNSRCIRQAPNVQSNSNGIERLGRHRLIPKRSRKYRRLVIKSIPGRGGQVNDQYAIWHSSFPLDTNCWISDRKRPVPLQRNKTGCNRFTAAHNQAGDRIHQRPLFPDQLGTDIREPIQRRSYSGKHPCRKSVNQLAYSPNQELLTRPMVQPITKVPYPEDPDLTTDETIQLIIMDKPTDTAADESSPK